MLGNDDSETMGVFTSTGLRSHVVLMELPVDQGFGEVVATVSRWASLLGRPSSVVALDAAWYAARSLAVVVDLLVTFTITLPTYIISK